eukprot:TRINITY_DN4488_c0_g2_i1.p1 TRINITY_DN4488_c0_g2~~TRINITY_DN4488_c0_g2_i1.p1  ORF type:complete len:218 (+),score=18.12 TRINITY_DN4488_c0_g2_i1:34-687(+)
MLECSQFFAGQECSYTTIPGQLYLVLGNERSGKSSLLFQYAYNHVQKFKGSSVWFVCSRQKIQSQLPLFCEGVSPKQEHLRSIKMKYLEDAESMCYFLSSVHLMTDVPDLLIIDDLSSFITLGVPQALNNFCKILAYLKHCYDYLITSQKKSNFMILASDTIHHDINLYKRWIKNVIMIEGQHNPFTIKFPPDLQNKSLSVTYDVTTKHLSIKNISS